MFLDWAIIFHHQIILLMTECGGRCSVRCSKTAFKKPCMFFCEKCCGKCLCVPPGTYGNKQFCPCYNNWKTKRGGPKCPWSIYIIYMPLNILINIYVSFIYYILFSLVFLTYINIYIHIMFINYYDEMGLLVSIIITCSCPPLYFVLN